MNGWLSPKGVLSPCSSRGHLDAADAIAKMLGISEANGWINDHKLHKLGWARVQRGYVLTDPEQRLTVSQKEWCWSHFDDLNEDMRSILELDKEDDIL